MNREEFGRIMKTLSDNFGGMTEGIYGTWYDALGGYQYQEVKAAAWSLITNMKIRPKIADMLEAMGKAGVGGGSNKTEPTGCDFCGGSGWASVELRSPERVFIPWLRIDEMRPQISVMRCVCERGCQLNQSYAQLTNQIISERWLNLLGQLRLPDRTAADRDVKLRSLDKEQLIKWANKGMKKLEERK